MGTRSLLPRAAPLHQVSSYSMQFVDNSTICNHYVFTQMNYYMTSASRLLLRTGTQPFFASRRKIYFLAALILIIYFRIICGCQLLKCQGLLPTALLNLQKIQNNCVLKIRIYFCHLFHNTGKLMSFKCSKTRMILFPLSSMHCQDKILKLFNVSI